MVAVEVHPVAAGCNVDLDEHHANKDGHHDKDNKHSHEDDHRDAQGARP
jgi:hypothetical protein